MKKKAKTKFNLIDEYKKSWNYIKESKNFIYSIIILFFVFALVGFFVPASPEIYDKIMEFIRELLEETQGLSQLGLIKFIILNNLKSTLYGILLGIFLGIFPVASAVANGYMLGFVSLLSVNDGGIFSLWRIFPHGIFELPAVFIALGLGLKLGTFVFQKDKLKTLRKYLINSLRIFLLIIVPLLLVAGIIEGLLIGFNL